MNDREYGIWMIENFELLMPLMEELKAAGKMLPETSDLAVVHNALVLVDEFKRRYPERDPEAINAFDEGKYEPGTGGWKTKRSN